MVRGYAAASTAPSEFYVLVPLDELLFDDPGQTALVNRCAVMLQGQAAVGDLAGTAA